MDEKEAVIHLQKGDFAGLEFLVRQYQVRAVYAAFLITQDRDLAEDVVQSAFIKVTEKIHQFDDSRPFAPWFYRIVTNDAVKLAQKQGRLQSIEEESDEETLALARYLVGDDPDPQWQLELKETSQHLQQAMQVLKPEQRAVVVMRYYLELSEKEMADKLDKPLSTIKWWLRCARKELSGLLSPDGRYIGGGRLK